jgi:DNA-binding HxlR family transcriptional regulator
MIKKPQICSECPVSNATKIVGDFWMLLIVRSLLTGPKRFNELAESLHGISRRTLTQKLQKAEAEGLVERREYAEAPPRVEYKLTPRGKKIRAIIKAVEAFSRD